MLCLSGRVFGRSKMKMLLTVRSFVLTRLCQVLYIRTPSVCERHNAVIASCIYFLMFQILTPFSRADAHDNAIEQEKLGWCSALLFHLAVNKLVRLYHEGVFEAHNVLDIHPFD